MSKPPAEKSRSARQIREAREAAALRANLLKRKDQTRERAIARTKPGSDPQRTGIGGSTPRLDPAPLDDQ